MKSEIDSNRKSYVTQMQQTEQTIRALEQRLVSERSRLEQLRGAVAALNDLERSLAEAEASKKPENTKEESQDGATQDQTA